jgi:hypothetical protein
LILGAALLTLSYAPAGFGATISGSFNGTFGGASTGTPPSGINAGNSLTGYFSYGTTTLKASSNGAHSEIYSLNVTNATSSSQALSFTILNSNPYPYQSFNDLYTGGNFQIIITDNTNAGGSVIAGAKMVIEAPTQYGATLMLTLTSATYTGLALPTTTTALASFVGSNKDLNYDAPFDFDTNVDVPLSNLSGPAAAVPEPSGVVLGAIATSCLAAFQFSRRRQRRNQ